MYRFKTYSILAILIGLYSTNSMKANHLSGGTLYYENTGPGQYTVSLVILQDCLDNVIVQDHSVRYASDCPDMTDLGAMTVSLLTSEQVLIDSCLVWPEGEACPQGSGFYRNTYRGTVTLGQDCDSYRFLFKQNYRTPSDNLETTWNSVYYIQTEVDNTVINQSSEWLNSTIPYACVGSSYDYQIEMSNPDGDSLAYEFSSALQADGAFGFAPVPYYDGFDGANPIPGISIDSETGAIQFPSPSIGKFTLVVKVSEYEDGVYKGSTLLDFLINVATCAESVLEITAMDNTLFLQDAPEDFSFQWYLDGNPIPGAIESFYIPGGTIGEYYVQLTSPGGCISQSSEFEILTSLQEFSQVTMSLVPNPIKEQSYLQLDIENTQGWKAVLFSSLGQEVRSVSIRSSRTLIDRDGLSTGIYLLQLQDSSGRTQGRLSFSVD